jgi:diguanylate cyclase (GGDEF)-like protein
LSIFTNQAYVSIENAKLHKKVIRDELTGTLSRSYFEFLIDKEIARAERYQSTFSLLNIDIDNFSFITDM